jgi:hypothetical protein
MGFAVTSQIATSFTSIDAGRQESTQSGDNSGIKIDEMLVGRNTMWVVAYATRCPFAAHVLVVKTPATAAHHGCWVMALETKVVVCSDIR